MIKKVQNYELDYENVNKEYFLNQHLQDEERPERILAMCEVKDGKLYLLDNEEYILETTDNILNKLVEGNIVLVKTKNNNLKQCNILEVLGHKDDPQIDLKIIAISKSFKIEFNKDSLKQLENINTSVSEDEITGRLDLRDEMIFTIDGKDTKDMDDAISVKKNEKGNYILGVHIADVSHYVPINSPLFNEASNRATSLYLIDSVIPMLPHQLSNGICSLNPNVDRLTLSCIMEINPKGEIINYQITESVINSKKKMTYEDIDKILMKNEIVEGYEEFVENLKLCNELSFILNENYKKHGYLHFKTEELKVTVDKDGKAICFNPIKVLAGRKIIENFMLAANKSIAQNYEYMPFCFRTHKTPDINELQKALEFVENLGYQISHRNLDNPNKLNSIFKILYESGNYSIISPFLLKAMHKAKYSPDNDGHFGLGFDQYTHFTSPIRRFNDLLVHTLIKIYNNPNLTDEDITKIQSQLRGICEHISNKEILADEAEEDALKYKMAEYMSSHIGEYFNGKIIDLGSKYITIRLENGVIGKAYLENIKGRNFYFDKDNYKIISSSSKIEYKIADYVRIKVLSTSKQLRTIDFKLIENLEHVKTKTLTLN